MEEITYSYKLYGGKQLKKSLSKEEQNKYLELSAQGNYDAQEKIFEHNLRLVANVINKYYYKEDSHQKEELFQVGSLGLWKSIQRFNVEFNVEFSTYAVPMIIGEIRRYLRDNNSPIRIARSVRDLAYKTLKLQEEYLQKNIELTTKQMSEILEENEEDIKDALTAFQQVASLEEQLYSDKDGDSISLGESIQDTDISLEQQFEEKERNELILNVLNSLGERESLIVRKLFGIGCKQKTQMEIASEIGLSQAQVSRIYHNVLTRLNNILPKYLNGVLKFEQSKNQKQEQQNTATVKSTTMQETIFDLYPNYTKQEVLGAISSLSDINRKTIKLRYGINNNKCYSNREIAEQLGEKRHIISSRIGNILKQITRKLENGKIGKETIFDLYLEYTEEQIIEAINLLSSKNKEIIELKYGLNEKNILSNKEIAQKYNLKSSDSVSARISTIKKQIKSRLDGRTSKKSTDNNTSMESKSSKKRNNSIFEIFNEYSKEEVLDAMNILSEENKKIIELKYGLNGNKVTSNIEIGKIFNMDELNVAPRIFSIKRQITRVLKNGFPKEEQIVDVFKDYKESEILEAIETLSEENKKIIELKYGLNGNKRISNKEISELLNIEHNKIGSRINNIKIQINRKLKTGLKEETIFDLYPTYTKEEILKAISELENIKKLILELKYGLNGKSKKENHEIAKILKLEPNVVNSKLGISKVQIKRKLKQGSEKFMRTQSIYEVFPENTEVEILGAISTLNYKEKFIIELKYGLNGRQAISNTEIAKLLNETSITVNNKIYQLKNQIAKKLEKGQFKKETIFDAFPNYTEEQVLGAISTLSDENRETIELKYGLNGKEETKNQEIASKLNIDEKTVSGKICNIKRQIIQRLEKGKTKVETIFDLFPEYTEEQILDVINQLKKENKEIIELKYGLNGNTITPSKEIAEQYGYTSQTISTKIYQIKNQISKKLEKKFVKIKKDIVNTSDILNKKEDVEILDFDEKPKYELSYQTKVKELEEAILQNKKMGDSVFKIGGVNVSLKVYHTTCLLATLDTKTNSLNRAHGIKKDCYVYRITAIDSKNKELYEKFLIKDSKNGKFYNFVYRYTNGEYDLSKMKYNELVCYDMQGIYVKQIYVKEPEIKKVINTQKPIIRDRFDRKKEELNHQEPKEELPDYKQALEDGIKLFKERQVVLAEAEFLKALGSKKSYVLQKSNYYLGKIYFIKKKGIIAEKYLKASLEINNKSYPVLFEMGKALALQHKYEEAINCFDECETIAKPHYINHIVEKAKCYIEQGKTEDGLKTLNVAELKSPNNYFVCYEKGKLFFDLNKFDEARIELEKCEKLLPQYERHKTILGKIEYLEGDFQKANDWFNEVVEINLNNNVIYGIVNIAYFFHKRGEKDLAYKYYSKAPRVNNWLNLSEEEAEEHIQNHNQYTEGQIMHSVFNFKASLGILNTLIKDMEKTTTKEIFDVYQVHCENAGYMVIDGENNTKKEDYITILTLPFTKKIANAYPDDKMEGVEVNRTVKLEWLTTFTEKVEANNLQPNQQEKADEKTIVEQTVQKEENKEVEVVVEETSQQNEVPNTNNDSSTKSLEMVIDNIQEQSQPGTKEIVEENETTIIKNKFELPINLDFENNKSQIKTLINMLSEPTEQVVLLLRLGYINDKHYTVKEIGEFLNIDEEKVNNLITSSLSNIINCSISLMSKKIEDTQGQLGIVKNLTLN